MKYWWVGVMQKDLSKLSIGDRCGDRVVVGFKGKQVSLRCLRCGCTVKKRRKHALEQCRCRSLQSGASRAKSITHSSWEQMIRRCCSPLDAGYFRYGGRGIKVWKPWRLSFAVFLRDVGERPSPRHSLGRIDNDGDYRPGNVRWETARQQARNKSTTRWVEFQGVHLSLEEWAEIKSIGSSTLRKRLNRGWSVSRALTEPVGLRTK